MSFDFGPEQQCSFQKPYHKPILEELGDLRDITLGGSVGAGESSVSEGSFGAREPGTSHKVGAHNSNLPNLIDLQKTRQARKK